MGVWVRVLVRACACVPACVHARARAYICVCVCVRGRVVMLLCGQWGGWVGGGGGREGGRVPFPLPFFLAHFHLSRSDVTLHSARQSERDLQGWLAGAGTLSQQLGKEARQERRLLFMVAAPRAHRRCRRCRRCCCRFRGRAKRRF